MQLQCYTKTATRLTPIEWYKVEQNPKQSLYTPQVNARSVVEAKRSSERVAGWRSEWRAQTKSAEEFRRSAVAVIRDTT